MGDKYGPMVITRKPDPLEILKGKTIAIPGELTTAFLALQLCHRQRPAKPFFYEVVHFDQIPGT